MTAPRTLYDKLWDAHVIETRDDGTALLAIDRHLVHEVTSPQAFEGLRVNGRSVRQPTRTLAVADHNVPTVDRAAGIADPTSREQVDALVSNCRDFHVPYIALDDQRQGIVHIIGPEQGFTLPGTTLVCGDSHTSTHGAFGALAFGIGTSEVEHVLATSTLPQARSRVFQVQAEGAWPQGVGSKDLALALIAAIGTAGATGHVLEFQGSAIEALSMEGRMALCNMAIEAGARSGIVAPDETTFAYLKGRPMAPRGDAWEAAVAQWQELRADEGARYDNSWQIDVSTLAPMATWGTSPEMGTPIEGIVPLLESSASESQRTAWARAVDYMGLTPGMRIQDIPIDVVFIGSCTNGRIEDLRAAAAVAKGRRVKAGVQALVVPGSGLVKAQAEAEGLHAVFLEAGFQWRAPGCSMCLAMNADRLEPRQRCAATSNRTFEGRQGRLGRTHLVSPATAAASAIEGRLANPRCFL